MSLLTYRGACMIRGLAASFFGEDLDRGGFESLLMILDSILFPSKRAVSDLILVKLKP